MAKIKKIRVGSRDSQLAMTQTEYVIDLLKANYPDYQFDIITFKTLGDKILDKKLDKIGGKGLFIKELQDAMQAGEIDFAVHSLKDMPAQIIGDTYLAAVPERENRADALVLPVGKRLEDLGEKPVLGTSSIRREIQLRKWRPEATIKVLRGNLNTRLAKLDAGEYDAIILAVAGLKRLHLADRISKIFDYQELMPAVSQGALGIEAPLHTAYREMFASINHQLSRAEVLAERAFLEALDGSCSVPIAAYTEIDDDKLILHGLYGDEQSKQYSRDSRSGLLSDYQAMAIDLAADLKGQVLSLKGH